MKIITLTIIGAFFLMFGCSSPKPFEIKDLCAQPEGTKVILQGYLSLPKTIDTIQLTKGDSITAVGYQIFLMTKADATGDSAKVTIWTTNKSEPNKIKPLPNGYTGNDLIVYSDKGEEIKSGKQIKITGETVADSKTGCAVSVTKIETP
ncbi:MAG TPA: hypothetical protein PKE69_08535 [Pyrinomonadaceae bacterium]|nr:hypothetical protein [Pyrinomonadaceae bacterium]